MAFCNKLGGLLRQSVSQSGYMLNSIRCMSSKRLFVGGLSYGTDDQSLKDAFSSFGDVTSARVITDRDSGRSRGFGFVDFDTSDNASSALSAMDGQELQGRNIRVSLATERPERSNNQRSFNNNRGFGNDGY
ncbi:glycine-rich RNA-binding protein 4, mitochondrial [Euphorbia lathyris]|uniref:glycine-rich RNA-binding protein 4, mitochondrial n=1 Tax=Euphorbia lathyris TaxID=212925 RepID=UPI003313F6FC